MSNQQKRGFRLPWAPDRDPDEGVAAATIDADALDTPAAVSDEPDEGTAPISGATSPAMTTDAVPAASDVPDVTPEAEMIDAENEAKDRIERARNVGAWPTTEWSAAPQKGNPDESTAHVGAPPNEDPATSHPPVDPARVPRRENPLVAGLVKAMREAALASRAETTSRLAAEATARVEAIRAEATTQSADLRKRVDDDISRIREWSKGEMARIRAETEGRIETRRAEAINETKAHGDAVEHLIEQVQGQVSAFEADMDSFFEQLLAETDPAKLATLAERAPEPPDLSGELPTLTGEWQDATWSSDDSSGVMADAGDVAEAHDDTPFADDANTGPQAEAAPADALGAAAAAEAEAEATEGLEMPAGDGWPAAVLAAASRKDEGHNNAAGDAGHSRLLVSGLTSVAGISAFKGAVGQLPGVRSVSVTSGERGVFIFTVSHEPEADIAEAVTSLTNFSVRITEASGDSVSVTADEPAA